jgi:site-specific DNA-methyltransferase (adenine-specific)/modification methylase
MTILRKEVIGNQTLLLGDCIKVMPLLGRFDACVTDPPYGIGEGNAKGQTRGKMAAPRQYGGTDGWDDTPATAEHMAMIRGISKHQIIFGGNYFEGLGPTSCWLVWDKQNGENDFADCELAWTNLPKAVRRIYWRWNGMIRRGDDVRVHPTQKPVGVMEWCLGHIPDAQTILDPFAGSGTTAVASQRMGRACTAIEADPEFFDAMCRRVDEAARQPDLLIPETRQAPKQEQLL